MGTHPEVANPVPCQSMLANPWDLTMKSNSILLFNPADPHGFDLYRNLLTFDPDLSLRITQSVDETLRQIQQSIPDLLILAGNEQDWPSSLVAGCRAIAGDAALLILAITTGCALDWTQPQDHPGVDGFLVQPIGDGILRLLFQSAKLRQIKAPSLP
jgi:hypothetical protein